MDPSSPAPPIERIVDAEPAIVRGFSSAAADALARGPMSLTERDRLITRGVRLGLRRFDANLILAVAEQRHRTHPGLRLVYDRHGVAASALPRWLAWTTVAVIQFMIAGGVWWVVT